MNFNKLIERVKAILLTPRTEWPVIATESTTVSDLYLNYIAIVAAIPAIFGFIKGSLIGIDLPMIGTMRVGIGAGIGGMLLSYALSLVQVYVIALIIDALAPTFGAQKNQVQALKVAAYSFTAAWVASVLQIVPWIGWLIALAGAVYSIYLLYLGLTPVMQCPPDKSVGYTVVTVIIAIVLSIIIAAVVGGITGGVAPGIGSSDIEYDKDSPLGDLEGYAKKLEEASKQVEAAGQSGDAEAQTQAIGALIGTAIGGGDKVEALAPDQLKPFLPESLADLPRTDMSVERNAAMGMQISEAHATFSDQGGRTLRLEITDTGSAKGFMALAGFVDVQEDKITNTGFSKTYKDDDGRIVHEQWDNGGSGEYSVVVGDRFTVKVSGDAEEFDQLKAALNEVNLAGLEALKDSGVTSQ
ncbi:MAG TPA: Yip1 family protein [Pseudomonadales bacterium]